MIYLLIASTIWAFSFGIIKDNLSGVDTNLVSFCRLFLSFLVFIPFLKIKNLPKQIILRLFLIGMVQYGLMYITYIYSFRFLQAYEVALFTILTPLYVTLLNRIKSSSHFTMNLATAVLAILGAAIIEKVRLGHSDVILGFIIIQISNFCFAYGQIEYKSTLERLPAIKDAQIFGVLYLGGMSITALSTLLFSDISSIQMTWTQGFSILYLGIVASGVGFFIWNFGARRTNSGALAIFNNLKIPLAVAVSLIFFHESADLSALIVGGCFMAAALILNEWSVNKAVKVQKEFTKS